MCRSKLCAVWFCFFFLVSVCLAQGPADADGLSTTCTFADGQQVSLRYSPATKDPDMNGVWSPGGAPMYLFTQTNITLNKQVIPAGAYSVYLTGKKNDWALIVNKNVKPGASYDQQQDLVRAPMEVGKLAAADKQMRLYFVHAEPKNCNLRIYYLNNGYWAEFKEQ